MFRSYRSIHPHAGAGFTPAQLARAYRFPDGYDGTGQTIGIISLGGGVMASQVQSLFGDYGQKAPQVSLALVGGAKNAPDGPNGADGENYLDIAMAGGTSPGAKILVCRGPNSAQGFLDTFSYAIDRCDIVSCSWGMSEAQTGAAAMDAMNQVLQQAAAAGVTVLVAAGDNGSGDGSPGKNVDFPSSSPSVLACGGTRLTLGADGSIAGESVWNDGAQGGATGGGLSTHFPTPVYQGGLGLNGRGVPDWSAVADPQTGVRLFIYGQRMVIGGTSAVAPLLAGLVARINQALGKRVGLLHPALYAGKGLGCRDAISGNNGAYQAGPGFDLCTGWGSPDGGKLLAALKGAQAPAPPPVQLPGQPPAGNPPTGAVPVIMVPPGYTLGPLGPGQYPLTKAG